MNHYTKKVNLRSNPQKTMDDLTAPFPKKYRHLAPLLRTVPASDVVQTIAGCAQVGFNDDAIADALRTLGQHHQQTEHRCSTCLAWAKGDNLFAGYVDSNGAFAVVTVCVKCQRMIVQGQATPTMERNLINYGLGLSEVLK